MATNLAEIEAFLKAENLKYTVQDEFIRTSFIMDSYRDRDGDPSLFLVIKPEENGEYFKLIAPSAYSYPPGPHSAAVYQALLQISWKTKLLQFEYDAEDGEIRAIIEFPLEDSALSAKQLMRCINGMVQILDEYHPVIEAAIERGVVDFKAAETKADAEREAMQIIDYVGMPPPDAEADLARDLLELEE